MKETTCCFSGYRPEKMPVGMEEGTPAFERMSRDLHTEILRAAEQGYTAFLSGMSRGFDLWAAEAVLELQERGLGLELWAAIAYHGMEQGWEPEWQRRYDAVLRRARHTFAVCDRYEPGCYTKRDAFLVQHSSYCICFFDGVPGGTQYTVGAARRAGHRVVNLAYQQQALEGF